MELYDLRGIMISLITKYNTNKDKLNDNKYKLDIYDSVLSILDSLYEEWSAETSMILSMQLELIFEEEIVDEYMQVILNYINDMKNYKVYEDEQKLEKSNRKLNKIIRSIKTDRDNLKVELSDIRDYLRNNSQLIYSCVNILRKLKFKAFIDEKDNETINHLMEEYSYDASSKILVQE